MGRYVCVCACVFCDDCQHRQERARPVPGCARLPTTRLAGGSARREQERQTAPWAILMAFLNQYPTGRAFLIQRPRTTHRVNRGSVCGYHLLARRSEERRVGKEWFG